MLAQKRQLDRDFAHNLARGAKVSASNVRADSASSSSSARYSAKFSNDDDTKTYWATRDGVKKASLTLDFGKEVGFNRLLLQEHIARGQRIHRFVMETQKNGEWTKAAEGTTIGYKRILRFPHITTAKVRLTFETDAPCLTLGNIGIFSAPAIMSEPALQSGKDGRVVVTGPAGTEIHCSVNQGEFQPYTAPLDLPLGGTVTAYAYDPVTKSKSDRVEKTFSLPKTDWQVHSSSFPNEGAASIEMLIDGNDQTMWHTHGKDGRVPPPHWVVIDLKKTYTLSGFLSMPRHDGAAIGLIDQYSLYVSDDGKDWTLASKGEFSNIKNNPIEQWVKLAKPMKARFVKFVAEHAVDDNSCAAMCELGFIATD